MRLGSYSKPQVRHSRFSVWQWKIRQFIHVYQLTCFLSVALSHSQNSCTTASQLLPEYHQAELNNRNITIATDLWNDYYGTIKYLIIAISKIITSSVLAAVISLFLVKNK